MDKDIYTCTHDFLNHGVGEITVKHVLKKQKYTVSPTLSVSAVVHFYSFSTVHIKDQKKKQMSMTRKYHNHTLQTKTRPDIIVHFIKQRNQFHFERKLYVQNVCPFQYLLSPCCRRARERFCCLLC